MYLHIFLKPFAITEENHTRFEEKLLFQNSERPHQDMYQLWPTSEQYKIISFSVTQRIVEVS